MKSSIFIGSKVMAKVKVFVHATAADADGRAMTLAPRTFVPGSLKNQLTIQTRCVCEIQMPPGGNKVHIKQDSQCFTF